MKRQGGESLNPPVPLPSSLGDSGSKADHAPYALPGIYHIGGLEGLPPFVEAMDFFFKAETGVGGGMCVSPHIWTSRHPEANYMPPSL